jgi:uncharacterized protein (TIGR02246 family)
MISWHIWAVKPKFGGGLSWSPHVPLALRLESFRRPTHQTFVLWRASFLNVTLRQAQPHSMKTIASILFLTVAFTGLCFAQGADNPPEKAAVVTNDRAYEAAYAKGDAKALADFFTDDAEYTTDDGRIFNGREAIETAVRTGLAANRGSKLAIAVDTVRVLGPESVLEKGATTVTAKDGEETRALYTAIHVKKDGKWKINQLIETPVPPMTARDRLAELEWLVGNWEESDKENDLTVSSQYSWARGGNFLTRNVTVKKAGQVALEGWQIIGWDPVEDRLRAWTFDNEGGFSEGRFTRDGERWLFRETGVTPEGSRISADNTITKVGPDRITWESNNRTLDGDPQPGVARIEIRRVKGD